MKNTRVKHAHVKPRIVTHNVKGEEISPNRWITPADRTIADGIAAPVNIAKPGTATKPRQRKVSAGQRAAMAKRNGL
jgi:hypothetical protein